MPVSYTHLGLLQTALADCLQDTEHTGSIYICCKLRGVEAHLYVFRAAIQLLKERKIDVYKRQLDECSPQHS